MTIKEFAKLCDCNPQTLRYYDSIDLLKPVNVDSWTGYRYYDEEQAVTFVKIKNLQKAGFSIDEIKELVQKDDLAVAMAFEKKIDEVETRLREIRTIQRSYLTEMMNIKEKISEVKNRIMGSIEAYDPTDEFGIEKKQYDSIRSNIEQCFAEVEQSDSFNKFGGMLPASTDMSAARPETPGFVKDPTYKVIYEKHGWTNVKDFLPEFENLESGEYGLDFCVTEDKYKDSIAFSNTILGVLLEKNEGKKKTLSCGVDKSADGQNHFRLFKKVIG